MTALDQAPKTERAAETSLAASIPPLEADHKAALARYLEVSARTLSDAEFDDMIRLYREKRRLEAAARIARDRKRAEATAKKAAAAAKKAAKATETNP